MIFMTDNLHKKKNNIDHVPTNRNHRHYRHRIDGDCTAYLNRRVSMIIVPSTHLLKCIHIPLFWFAMLQNLVG